MSAGRRHFRLYTRAVAVLVVTSCSSQALLLPCCRSLQHILERVAVTDICYNSLDPIFSPLIVNVDTLCNMQYAQPPVLLLSWQLRAVVNGSCCSDWFCVAVLRLCVCRLERPIILKCWTHSRMGDSRTLIGTSLFQSGLLLMC